MRSLQDNLVRQLVATASPESESLPRQRPLGVFARDLVVGVAANALIADEPTVYGSKEHEAALDVVLERLRVLRDQFRRVRFIQDKIEFKHPPTISIDRRSRKYAIFDGFELKLAFQPYTTEEEGLEIARSFLKFHTQVEPIVVYPEIKSVTASSGRRGK